MNCLVRRSRVVRVWAGFAGVAALLLTTGCHKPRETRSVHLPLAVGNRWVYDVTSDSMHGTAVVEVVSQDNGAYGLTVNCDSGHLAQSDSLLRLTCRDSVLSLSLIHISEPTRLLSISYAVFCLKKKKK